MSDCFSLGIYKQNAVLRLPPSSTLINKGRGDYHSVYGIKWILNGDFLSDGEATGAAADDNDDDNCEDNLNKDNHDKENHDKDNHNEYNHNKFTTKLNMTPPKILLILILIFFANKNYA